MTPIYTYFLQILLQQIILNVLTKFNINWIWFLIWICNNIKANKKHHGCVQGDESLFWRIRCNRKLKKEASINLGGCFETLTQWILGWVKNKKCRKLNEVSKYIIQIYNFFLLKMLLTLTETFLFLGQIVRYMFLWVHLVFFSVPYSFFFKWLRNKRDMDETLTLCFLSWGNDKI